MSRLEAGPGSRHRMTSTRLYYSYSRLYKRGNNSTREGREGEGEGGGGWGGHNFCVRKNSTAGSGVRLVGVGGGGRGAAQ